MSGKRPTEGCGVTCMGGGLVDGRDRDRGEGQDCEELRVEQDDATHRLRRRWFAGAFVSLLACGSMAVLALRLSPAATMAAAAPPALAPAASSYNALPRPIESARRRRLRRA